MDWAATGISSFIEPQIVDYAQKADLIHNVRIGREPLTIASHNIARKKNLPFLLTPLHHPRWKGWLYHIYHQLYQKAVLELLPLRQQRRKILTEFGVKKKKKYL